MNIAKQGKFITISLLIITIMSVALAFSQTVHKGEGSFSRFNIQNEVSKIK